MAALWQKKFISFVSGVNYQSNLCIAVSSVGVAEKAGLEGVTLLSLLPALSSDLQQLIFPPHLMMTL